MLWAVHDQLNSSWTHLDSISLYNNQLVHVKILLKERKFQAEYLLFWHKKSCSFDSDTISHLSRVWFSFWQPWSIREHCRIRSYTNLIIWFQVLLLDVGSSSHIQTRLVTWFRVFWHMGFAWTHRSLKRNLTIPSLNSYIQWSHCTSFPWISSPFLSQNAHFDLENCSQYLSIRVYGASKWLTSLEDFSTSEHARQDWLQRNIVTLVQSLCDACECKGENEKKGIYVPFS